MKTRSTLSLTDKQRAILRGAIERGDGTCELPDRTTARAAQRHAASFVEKGLGREVQTKAGMPIWGSNDAGRSMTLIITKRGREAIRVVGDAQGLEITPLAAVDRPELFTGRQRPRDGSKIAKVIVLVSRQTGASLPELIAATGWLPHTTRAALTGLRKRGYDVCLESQATGGKVYRIADNSTLAATA